MVFPASVEAEDEKCSGDTMGRLKVFFVSLSQMRCHRCGIVDFSVGINKSYIVDAIYAVRVVGESPNVLPGQMSCPD